MGQNFPLASRVLAGFIDMEGKEGWFLSLINA
jgi:hypothetical protein